jgi:hypothetical protein
MAFHVEIDERLVLAYLCHPDRRLAERDLNKLLSFLEELAETGEAYRSDPSRRYPQGPRSFR